MCIEYKNLKVFCDVNGNVLGGIWLFDLEVVIVIYNYVNYGVIGSGNWFVNVFVCFFLGNIVFFD